MLYIWILSYKFDLIQAKRVSHIKIKNKAQVSKNSNGCNVAEQLTSDPELGF